LIPNRIRWLTAFCGVWLIALNACSIQPASPAPTSTKRLGTLEVSFSGIGRDFTATARPWTPELRTQQPLRDVPQGIQLQPLSRSTFDVGRRGFDGTRFLSVTFRVRNANANGEAYPVAHHNLTLVAINTPNTIQGTAVRGLERFDGSNADPVFASSIAPTHGMSFDHAKRQPRVIAEGADMQVFSEAEIAALGNFDGITSVLPYGFVARCVTNCTPGSRALKANPAPDQFDGQVTLAVKIPLQTRATDDPFRFSMLFEVMQDDTTRVTQALEEQDDDALVQTRGSSLGGAPITALGGSTLPGSKLCAVRNAGTATNPTSFMLDLASVTEVEDLPESLTPLESVTVPFDRRLLEVDASSVQLVGSISGRRAGTASVQNGRLVFTPDPRAAFSPGERLELRLGKGLRFENASGLCEPVVLEFRARVLASSEALFHPERTFDDLISTRRPTQIVTADMDHDLDPDLLLLTAGGINLRTNLGDGNLDAPLGIGLPFGASSVAVADLNSDGNFDAVIAVPRLGQLVLLLGQGDGTFIDGDTLVEGVAVNVGKAPTMVVTADVNGDGHADLVICLSEEKTINVQFGNGDGTFRSEAALNLPTRSPPRSFEVADVNRDGQQDIVYVEERFVVVNLGNGTGRFEESERILVESLDLQSVRAADLDGDGWTDLVVQPKSRFNVAESVIVLFNSAQQGFLVRQDLSLPKDIEPKDTMVADMNGDDHMDVVVVGNSRVNRNSNLFLFLNNGDGSFQPARDLGLAGSDVALRMQVADMSGDGKLDLVISFADADRMAVMTQR
jgi:hypothetical protein